jgi:DNA-binding GntR family transcriptional regulator
MSEPAVTSIQQQSLAELAYRAIRASVVDGRLAGGTRLVETSLAADLGISRGTLREALGRLVEEGLLVQKPRRGTFVRALGGRDLVDLYNFRLAIETAAVRLVVRHRTPLEPLEEIIDQIKHAAASGDLAEVVAAEFRFHEALCELSGNPFLVEALRRLSTRLQMALGLDNQAFTGLPEVVEEHTTLLGTLRRANETEAADALGDHIRSTIGVVLRRWGIDANELLQEVG